MNDTSRRIPSREGHRVSYFRKFLYILITLFLLAMGCWSVTFSWPIRTVRYHPDSLVDGADYRLVDYPEAQYAFGMNAWLGFQPQQAKRCFLRAVSGNALYLDAWLNLAEIETEQGNQENAKAILAYTHDLSGQVHRWKWRQLLLARELGMDEIVFGNVNDLLSKDVFTQDVFQLIHADLGGSASAVIERLEPSHLTAYLLWLIRWGLPDQSERVWQAITAIKTPDRAIALRYVNFLLAHKRIIPAVEVWHQYTGSSGLTNPGFEKELTNQGFDWRYWGEKEGTWSMKRATYLTVEGDYALKISFNGKENISFQHVFQIVPVIPMKKYRLTYSWKSRGVTTDQGPFVEIYGYDTQGLYASGSVINGSQTWHEESITFETPADCHAAVLRLRRRPSMRFDSKIRGIVWFDDFRLTSEEEVPKSWSGVHGLGLALEGEMEREHMVPQETEARILETE